MIITAIFTVETTKLTIETSELLNLEQMGEMGRPLLVRNLPPGINVVPVDPGVFRLLSRYEVRVAVDSQNAHVMSMAESKDGDPPDPPKLTAMHFDRQAIHVFLGAARSMPLL